MISMAGLLALWSQPVEAHLDWPGKDISQEHRTLHCPHDGDCTACDLPDLRDEAAMQDCDSYAAACAEANSI